MDTVDFIAGIFMTLLVGLLTLAGVALYNQSQEMIQEQTRCEAAGGYFMDNMRRVGKSTHHNYSCMRKDLFVEYERK